jgi:hypothetical protein
LFRLASTSIFLISVSQGAGIIGGSYCPWLCWGFLWSSLWCCSPGSVFWVLGSVNVSPGPLLFSLWFPVCPFHQLWEAG